VYRRTSDNSNQLLVKRTGPGIEHTNAAVRTVGDVSGNESQSVDFRGRQQQPIDHRQRTPCASASSGQPAPSKSYRLIHWKQPADELTRHVRAGPVSELQSARASRHACDSALEFSKCQHTYEQIQR